MHDFLKHICADPDNMQLRLDYAEQLIESGDQDYAAFIQGQCRLATAHVGASEREQLVAQTQALLASHEAEWRARLDLPDAVEQVQWECGFIQAVTVDFNTLPGQLQRLMSAAPVTRLHVSDDCEIEQLSALAADPAFAQVRELELADIILDEEGAAALFASAHLTGLQSLSLSDEDSQCEILEHLLRAQLPALHSIRCFGFMSAALGDQGLAMLAESALAKNLQALDLFNLRISSSGAAHLAAAFPALRRLRLGSGSYSLNEIGAAGVAALAGSESLQQLEYLDLNFNSIGETGIEALANSKTLRRLKELHLQANGFSHDGFVYLSVSDVLDTVEVLDLSHNNVCARAVESLVISAPKQLRSLWLYHNPIEDRGVRMLANAPMTGQLKELNLSQTQMTDAGAQTLLDSQYLGGMESLYLRLNHFSSEMRKQLRERFGSVVHIED